MAPIKKKICLLGSFSVGKTSLVERFVYDRFDEKYLTTIGVNISQKLLEPITPPNSTKLVQHHFLIWDIASFEKFNAVTLNYFRGAAGALAVADLTRPETLTDIRHLCDQFLSVNAEAKLVFVGNKIDIFQGPETILNELGETARSFATHYLTTSAKTTEKVENAFMDLSKSILS